MKSVVVIAVVLVTIPAFAQRRVDVLVDAEGVRRTGNVTSFSPGTRFEPSFRSGGGGGVVHTIVKNINEKFGPTATGIRFKDPTGLVVDGGIEFNLGRRWNLLADARYVPIESKSRATFPGTTSSVDLSVRPAIVSFGLGYRF